MEGPSIQLAAAQLRPFVGRRVKRVGGNSRAGIERLERQTVRSIFAWGKHLVFQFDTTALRVHFLLWGALAVTVRRVSVTGNHRRPSAPRLVMEFANGEITIWSSSLRFIDDRNVKRTYDFTTDVLSDTWDPAAALRKVRRCKAAEIADVLLDQDIFAGVGNIIKNEVLFRTRTSPFAKVGRLSSRKLKAIIADAREFSFRFLELRRAFALRKNLKIYGRATCPSCGGPVLRRVHGVRRRRSFYCPACQDTSRVSRHRFVHVEHSV
jgi:endonuclease VIII